MGYECPVCGTPQTDARHLANHLAFTAMLGREDHETWLDEHAPGWESAGEDELAPRVAEHAPEAEFDEVFEDTAGRAGRPADPLEGGGEGDPGVIPEAHDHAHGHEHDSREAHLAGGGVDPDDLDAETRAVLEEARDLTREMLAEDAGSADSEETDPQRESGTSGQSDESGESEETDGSDGDNNA